MKLAKKKLSLIAVLVIVLAMTMLFVGCANTAATTGATANNTGATANNTGAPANGTVTPAEPTAAPTEPKPTESKPTKPNEPIEPVVDPSWTIIGSLQESGWAKDFKMTASEEENVLISVDTFDLVSGDKFKIRKDGAWNESYPVSDYQVKVSGLFRISFNTETKEIKLVWCGEGEEPTPDPEPTEKIWTAIGVLDGSNWDKDFAMVKSENANVLITEQSFTMAAGDTFKIRLNGAWDESYPGPVTNYTVEAAGTYYITFNTETHEIGLAPYEAETPVVPSVPADDTYVKVTQTQEDWSGTYLIVWEENNQVFNVALENFKDNAANGAAVEIVNGTIAASDELNAMRIMIEKVEGGYLVKTADGRYLSKSGNLTGIDITTNRDEAGIVTITIEDGKVKMAGAGGTVFCVDTYKAKNRFVFLATKYMQKEDEYDLVSFYKLTSGSAEQPDASKTTVNVSIADYATANGWENYKLYTEFEVDGVKFSVNEGKDNGKYNNNGNKWGVYQSSNGVLTISAEGKTIVSVKITYISKYEGDDYLVVGEQKYMSGDVINVNAESISLTVITEYVKNGSLKTNGQAQITAIEVICT